MMHEMQAPFLPPRILYAMLQLQHKQLSSLVLNGLSRGELWKTCPSMKEPGENLQHGVQKLGRWQLVEGLDSIQERRVL